MSSPGRARPRLLRELSEQAILETIFREGPITRPEIAARTNISKPTVSAVVERLVQAHLVEPPASARDAGGGRRSRSPSIPPPGSCSGSTSARRGCGWPPSTSTARCCASVELETGAGGAAGGRGADHVGAVREIDASPARHGDLLAMGVSTPGVVDPATRRVTSLA